MSISKPYFRIARPRAYIPDYVMDPRYATDRGQLSRAYINIEKELRGVFNYIEPDEENLHTFSFELYSLLLRASTEVELNCKLIMEANGATPQGHFFTMADYKKLEKSSLLSKYSVTYTNWRKRNAAGELEYINKLFVPFKTFDQSISTSPDWYQAYNEVKHNREENLEKANLENCMNAVAGVLVLLYSQFGSQCVQTYGTNGLHWHELGAYDLHFDADVIFEINPPKITDWPTDELYDFDWSSIKADLQPFEKFTF